MERYLNLFFTGIGFVVFLLALYGAVRLAERFGLLS